MSISFDFVPFFGGIRGVGVESKIQKKILDKFKANESDWFAYKQVSYTRGVGDVVAVSLVSPIVLFFEVKDPEDGDESEIQAYNREKINQQYERSYLVESVSDVAEILSKHGLRF